MNLCAALATYCFFETKPEVLPTLFNVHGQHRLILEEAICSQCLAQDYNEVVYNNVGNE